LFTYILFGAIYQKVGMQQVVDNQVRMDPKSQERMANATPEQRAMGAKIGIYATEGAFIGGPVIAMGVVAIMSLALMATINFGFGGKAKFSDIFAVSYYAWLPEILRAILGTIVIYMTLRLFNTLTGQLDELEPLDGKALRMYACGPTVYDYGHIGNFRTFLQIDVLRRFLR
jgi:hypothetical protein